MPSHDIICPVCLTPAIKWFEFGGSADPHGYYHCGTCGRSCAVQHRRDGQPGHCTPWVRIGTGTSPVADRLDNSNSDSFVNVRHNLMTNPMERDGGAVETVTVRPKPDRREQRRIPLQAVARRAYELHEQRGGEHGHDLDDWFRAEHDVRVGLAMCP
jgi:hypothetical protein